MQFNFVLGVPGCTPATVPNLCWLVNAIPAGSTWTATGIGRHAFTLAAPAIAMGGNVRVGFEDNLYLEKGVLAKSNGELVAKVVRIAKELGREIATSAEARKILNLKAKGWKAIGYKSKGIKWKNKSKYKIKELKVKVINPEEVDIQNLCTTKGYVEKNNER